MKDQNKVTEQMKAYEIREKLKHAHGTENYYYHPLFKRINYTDGVKLMYEICEAHWLLIDTLANCMLLKNKEEFIVIKLSRELNESTAKLTFSDGNGNILKTIDYGFTDFPLYNLENEVSPTMKFPEPAMTMWFENNVLFLPSER